ncbi:ribonuclease domain-containing protein [Jatrophihabitans sp. DSM 45814]
MVKLRTLLRRRPLLALIVLILLLVIGYASRALDHKDSGTASKTAGTSSESVAAGPARSATGTLSTLPSQSTHKQSEHETTLSALPVQARDTVALIQRGGPFPYSHDGIVYNNLERHLPIKPTGYYHEYTVVTPGSTDRGARRIITGSAGEFYYTSDHYASFVTIDLSR